MKGVNAKVKIDKYSILNKFTAFTKELLELCEKYGLEPQTAADSKTHETFIIVNVKDFIQKEDIDVMIEKGR